LCIGVYYDVPQLAVSIYDGSRPYEYNYSKTSGGPSAVTAYNVAPALLPAGASVSTATLVNAMAGFEQQAIRVDYSSGFLSPSGSFTLGFNGAKTYALNAHVSASDIQTALSVYNDIF
jgi:hypothetical protein